MESWRGSNRNLAVLIGTLTAVDLLLIVIYLFGGWLHARDWLLTGFFNLDGDLGMPTWYSSVLLLMVGAVWAMVGRGAYRMRCWGWLPALGLAGLFLLMSIDEVATIHENLGYFLDQLVLSNGREHSSLARTGTWFIFVGPPALGGLLGLAWLVGRSFGRRPAAVFAAGVVCYIGSAVGIEGAWNFMPPTTAWHYFEVAAEEGGEMLSTTLMLLGALLVYQRVFGPLALPTPRSPAPPAADATDERGSNKREPMAAKSEMAGGAGPTTSHQPPARLFDSAVDAGGGDAQAVGRRGRGGRG